MRWQTSRELAATRVRSVSRHATRVPPSLWKACHRLPRPAPSSRRHELQNAGASATPTSPRCSYVHAAAVADDDDVATNPAQ